MRRPANIVPIAGILIVILVMIPLIPPLPAGIGRSEFRFNWIAGYLLLHGENMYDVDRVWQVQNDLTGAQVPFPLLTLSPPWTVLALSPYSLVPFDRAASLWFFANLAGLVLSSWLLWRNARSEKILRQKWVPLVATLSFSMTLTTLATGQTTLFVLAAIALYIYLDTTHRDFAAGVALAGLAFKPQMVYIALVCLAIYTVARRRWQIGIGFIFTALSAALFLFVLRPTWLTEYWQALGKGNALAWESSNPSGILLVMTGWTGAKLILPAIVLPASVWFSWRYAGRIQLRSLVDASILGSVLTAPYDFSYDHVILLVPLLSVLGGIAQLQFSRFESFALVFLLIAGNLFSYYQRFGGVSSEVGFAWIPVAVALVYGYFFLREKSAVTPAAI